MTEEQEHYEKLPAEYRADLLSGDESVFFNVAKFEQAQRVAQMFAKSDMVPKHFRGNIGNCMIALNYAIRIKADPFMVLQTLYVVHGRPGIEGKLAIALTNQSGRFEPLEFEEDEKGCLAFATEKKSGKVLKGVKITWEMVKTEGWDSKNGPDGTPKSNKWKTMPQQMFRYRAATFFARTYCPEVLLGMETIEEIEDTIQLKRGMDGSYVTSLQSDRAEEKKGKPVYDVKPVNPFVPPENDKPAMDSPAGPFEGTRPPVEHVDLDNVGLTEKQKESAGNTLTYGIDWDPYKSEVQAKYGNKKFAVLKAEAAKKGLDINGKLPREVHAMLLDHAKKAEKPEGDNQDQGANGDSGASEEASSGGNGGEMTQEVKLHAVVMEMIAAELKSDPITVDMARVNAGLKTTRPDNLADAEKLKEEIIRLKEKKLHF